MQLSGKAPPAALTQSLGKIRSRLANEYRRADDDLAHQKEELEAIREELLQQHDRLVKQQHEFQQSCARQRQQDEQMAERLVAREQQLQQQESALGQRAEQWENERLEYQREIRRLRARLPEPDECLLPA